MERFQEYVNLAFRLSDDSGTHPDPHPLVKSSFVAPSIATVPPLTRLTHVLSTLPNLRTFVTRLPNVWSQNILRVSRNPALEKIVLEDLALPPPTGSGPENVYDYGIQGTGLFFKEAKKYPRLCELIRAGLGFGFPGRFACLLLCKSFLKELTSIPLQPDHTHTGTNPRHA